MERQADCDNAQSSARGNIIQPFIGVQGAVTLNNIRHFILSMQEILTDII
jgi:hypothetical protein